MSNSERGTLMYFWALVAALFFMATTQAIMNGEISAIPSASPNYSGVGTLLTVLIHSCLGALMVYAMFLRMSGSCVVTRERRLGLGCGSAARCRPGILDFPLEPSCFTPTDDFCGVDCQMLPSRPRPALCPVTNGPNSLQRRSIDAR